MLAISCNQKYAIKFNTHVTKYVLNLLIIIYIIIYMPHIVRNILN